MTAEEYLDSCRERVLEEIELKRRLARAPSGAKGMQALRKRLDALEQLRLDHHDSAIAVLSSCGLAPMEIQVMEMYYLDGMTLRDISYRIRYSYGYVRCVRRDAGEKLRRVRNVAVYLKRD